MPSVKVADGIYWVGAVDWNIRYFHGPAYSTHRGTTYNAYLIMDEQITLVDTVYRPFAGDLLRHIREVVDPSRINNVIINHIETDHSGSLPVIMDLVPNARIYCTQRGKEGLEKHYFGDWDYNVVKTGDELKIGKKTISFIEAPMLHWPDSMFSYVKEDAVLMPNDAFGQHIATNFRFDDEVDIDEVMDEAAKYYANILLPFSPLVLKKIDEVTKLGIDIKMICPSHGIIWRKDPGRIINAYLKWAKGEAERKVIVVYDTMWESTEKMAKAILAGLTAAGVTAKLFKLSVSDRNDIIKEMINARAVIVGSPTINNDILPTIAPLLDDMKGLKPRNKLGLAFGSYGWGGGAVGTIEGRLKDAGLEIISEPVTVKWVPTPEELDKCYEAGKMVAEKL
ncbi:MAG: MBL fold metallo-hydrolase [Firmicutes bacterium HGW-Firmicutes-14]|nr:MAG: MBL fold metallo-hydrolase [Firmicutes bacterium HGW-Firmicutes-14]